MTTIPADVLTRVLESADRAPSVHGTRPWRWNVVPDGVELIAANERRLVTTDPEGRDLVISCGAALYSLEVAAAAAGWRARSQRLPEPNSPVVLARVHFEPRPASPDDRSRAANLKSRRIDRRPGMLWPIPHERLTQACEQASRRGVLAVPLLSDEQREAVLDLMETAARTQGRVPSYGEELATSGQTRRPADVSDVEAGWLVLATSSDDALSWLRTGEALQMIWLWASGHGLSLVPHSQVVEVPSTRRRLQAELFDDTACPQIVVRLGWPPLEPKAELNVESRAAAMSAGTNARGA
jgi:nitroreductase